MDKKGSSSSPHNGNHFSSYNYLCNKKKELCQRLLLAIEPANRGECGNVSGD